MATFTLAGRQLGGIGSAQQHDAGLVILTFAVPLQALSTIYGFLARDSSAGDKHGPASRRLAVHRRSHLQRGRPGQTSGALGLLLPGAGTALLVPAVTAAMSKKLASVVMALRAVRFYLTGTYELSASAGWKEAAGITGLILSAVALYAGLAFELEDSRRATVLPTLRRGPGRKALAGDLPDEIAGIQHEAGGRQKL